MEQSCLCKHCINQLTCNECDFCKQTTHDGFAPVISCPNYKYVETVSEVNDAD